MPEPKPQYVFDSTDSDSLMLSDIRELLYIRARQEIPDWPRFREFELRRMVGTGVRIDRPSTERQEPPK